MREKFTPKIEIEENEIKKESETKEIREKEKKFIEKLNVSLDKKLDLALLNLSQKKVALLSNHEIIEGKKEKKQIVKNLTEEFKETKNSLDQLNYFYHLEDKLQDESIPGFNISVSKNEKYLSEFVEAKKRGDDKKIGLLLGYPSTAVEVYNSHQSLDFEIFFNQELSENERKELKEEGVLNFLSFQPSKKHWKEELEKVREIQRLIKENFSKLYKEIMEKSNSIS